MSHTRTQNLLKELGTGQKACVIVCELFNSKLPLIPVFSVDKGSQVWKQRMNSSSYSL